MEKYSNVVTNTRGVAVAGASVLVTQYPSGAPATIYLTDGGSPTTAPISTGSNGAFSFYAADGHYSLTVSGVGITTYTLQDILLGDVSSLKSNLGSSSGLSIIGYSAPGSSINVGLKSQLDKIFHTSNYPSLQAAHDACAAAGGGTLWIDGTVVSNVPFEWDYNKVHISGYQGLVSQLDFRGIPGPANPDVDKFAFVWRNPAATRGKKFMSHLRILGPMANVGVSCFPLFSDVGDAITHLDFTGITILDFETQLYFGSQCSNVNFSNSFFRNSDGDAFRTSTVIKTSTAPLENGGECWTFSQCQFANVNKVIENNTGIAGGWMFSQCALVYFNSLFDLRSPCRVSVVQGHTESNVYNNNWVSLNGNGCTVRFTDHEFWFANSITKEPFFCATNVVFGGLRIKDCDYHSLEGGTINYWSDRMGGGPVVVNGWYAQDSNMRIPFGMNPGIQLEAWRASSVNFGAGFHAQPGDGSLVGVSAAQPFDDGTGNTNVTVITTSAIGQYMRRDRRYRIETGDSVEASIYVKSTGFAADGTTFALYVTIFDINGIAMGGGAVLEPAGDVANYQKVSLNFYPSAPSGAAYFDFVIFAGAANTATVRSIYFAEMVVNAY